MAQATLLGPTAKIVLVVLWMVVTVGIGSNWIYKISRQGNVGDIASARIVLSLTEDLRRLNLRFGILYVRDGKDEVPDHGKLENKRIPFEAIDRQGTLVAVIEHRRRLGFQFKCFVESRPVEFARIKKLLEEAHFSDVSEGGADPSTVWFIHPKYPKYKTMDHDPILNNFYYPA